MCCWRFLLLDSLRMSILHSDLIYWSTAWKIPKVSPIVVVSIQAHHATAKLRIGELKCQWFHLFLSWCNGQHSTWRCQYPRLPMPGPCWRRNHWYKRKVIGRPWCFNWGESITRAARWPVFIINSSGSGLLFHMRWQWYAHGSCVFEVSLDLGRGCPYMPLTQTKSWQEVNPASPGPVTWHV